MKTPRVAAFILLSIIVLSGGQSAVAQWKIIAPGLTSPSGGSNGGIIVHHGTTLWACFDGAWISNDLGKTWSLRNPLPSRKSGVIDDISILDDLTQVVTSGSLMFITHNQGFSWQDISPPGASGVLTGVAFAGSDRNIIASENDGKIFVSTDGGLQWTSKQLDICVFSVRAGNGGTAYAAAGNTTGSGRLYETTDAGLSWHLTPGGYDWDSYSFERDPCDTNTFYIANEEILGEVDQMSSIFVSHDKGVSWQSHSPFSLPHYCGSIAVAPGALFAQTYSGVERSTDQGATWKDIGGPANSLDTRMVTAIDGNTAFSIDEQGNLWATFNSGGDSLGFFPVVGTLDITPRSLFTFDTIKCNDSILRPLSLAKKGCNPPSILKMSISGRDSLSFNVKNVSSDSLSVEFAPLTAGDNFASLIIVRSDGRSDTIALHGFDNSKPFSYSIAPQSLFDGDSLYLCSPPSIRKLFLNTGGCIPKIVSQAITGNDAKDYQFIRQASSPLIPFDSIILSFDPSDSGRRNGIYELILDDGTKISIPLLGYGIAPHPLLLSTEDEKTDTIGGSVNVPIVIKGLDHAEDIDLILHYGEELTYHGSYSVLNVPFDVPSEGWSGRSKLHILQAKPDTILGYARFDVFNDSLQRSYVTFDSVTVTTAISPCQYILPASVLSTVTPPFGCGIQTLSRFLHTGSVPKLSIVPNPTGGEISITSTSDLGESDAVIYDILGIEKGVFPLSLSKNTPSKLFLPFGNGIYNIRIRTTERTFDLRVLVNR